MGVRKACRFPRSLLGPCSGIEDREFGFKDGKPCFIVKLNRIVNFRPKVILNEYIFQLLVLSAPIFPPGILPAVSGYIIWIVTSFRGCLPALGSDLSLQVGSLLLASVALKKRSK